ncbi:MAG: polyphosphate kinase 1 [Acidimicrobiia bacterium]|nr:polyphosphate kinase 1 [Acidimicrobiia bacterium]
MYDASPMTSDRFLNRELSLLDFQERVLALGERTDLPLLERVNYAAIVSSNLDEFFQVRVAGLKEQVSAGVHGDAASTLAAIRPKVRELESRRDALVAKELLPQLAEAGIHMIGWSDLGSDARAYMSEVFEHDVFPVLTPLAIDPSHPFPFISNLSLNLGVLVTTPDGDRRFARVKVPPSLPRFFAAPDDGGWLPLEHLIAAHTDRMFPGVTVDGLHVFRVTRNADLALEEAEADDLLEAIETVLQFRRHSAAAVRVEVEAGIPSDVLDLLLENLHLDREDVFECETLLGLSSLWQFFGMDRPDLKSPPWTPTTPSRLANRGDDRVDMFTEMRRGDILVHHPYESFNTSTAAFLAQAAADPDVLAIKQTLYRTSVQADPEFGGEAGIVRSLISAAEVGKQVAVLIELKARFDEEANINWARMLESAGVHVVYGVTGLKTHAKIALVVRREAGGLRRYSHVGTGNYNPKTARIYEDLGLFTADPDIGADLSELFNALTGFGREAEYRKLLVAPRDLRPRILDRIREQATLGTEGRIEMKINHLVDHKVIEALYEASNAGCSIDLNIRGICCIRPGVPGMSENIRLRSVVGEFLEHSRIYKFGAGVEEAVYYMGSADMMPRNLDGRVESLTPVTDPRLKHRIQEILDAGFEDDALAWTLTDDRWSKVPVVTATSVHARLKEAALSRASD